MEKLVEVSSQEVLIDFTLGSKCRANVHLRSLVSTTPIAFKIQTSSPQKFLVKPPTGIIPPLSHTTIQLILKPQSQIPQTFPHSPSDRFLIKTTPHTSQDFANSYDIKLKVALVGPFLLKHALSNKDYDAIKKILKRQKTILSQLSAKDAQSILELEMDRSKYVEKGWTDLHVAVEFDKVEEVLKLVRMGGDKMGRTALHLAVSKGNERCVRALVEGGVDVDARSKDGRTGLFRAAANGDVRMVEVLMGLGADPTIVEMDRGRSAIHVARDKGHKEVIEILEQGEAVLNAARHGELTRLESLLEQDASVSYRDQYGLVALHVAAIKGYKDAVMLLVEFGSNLESQDSGGHTALHMAVEGGSVDTVEVLVNRGANVNAMSKKGITPLYIARAMGYNDISQFLLDMGASASITS